MSLIITAPFTTPAAPPYIPTQPFSKYRLTDFIVTDYQGNGTTTLNEFDFIDTNNILHYGTQAVSFTANVNPYDVYPPGAGSYELISDNNTGTAAYYYASTATQVYFDMDFGQSFTIQQMQFIVPQIGGFRFKRFSVYGFDGTNWVIVGYTDVPAAGGSLVSVYLNSPGPAPQATNLLSTSNVQYSTNEISISPGGNIVYLQSPATGVTYELYTDMTNRLYPTDTLLYSEVLLHREGCGGLRLPALISQQGYGVGYVELDTQGLISVLNSNGTTTTINTGITLSSGDVVSILYDRTNMTVEFWKNGVSIGSPVNWDIADGIFGWRSNCPTAAVEVNAGQLQFVYDPPAGYQPWIFG